MSRREIREHIFKLLFLLEFYQQEEISAQAELYMDEVEEAVFSEADYAYILEKFGRIRENLPQIDGRLSEKTTGWKISRMSKVDLAILRLAVYEMELDDDIPVGVAINEAVELAKKFSGGDSSSFVNGVLAKVAGKQ